MALSKINLTLGPYSMFRNVEKERESMGEFKLIISMEATQIKTTCLRM